jgi:hypothetical protein
MLTKLDSNVESPKNGFSKLRRNRSVINRPSVSFAGRITLGYLCRGLRHEEAERVPVTAILRGRQAVLKQYSRTIQQSSVYRLR